MRKSKGFFTLGLCLAFWAMCLINFSLPASAVLSQTKILKSGTPVILTLSQNLNSETARVGGEVEFLVARDVKVEDTVVISQGARARGSIASVEKRGILGAGGKIVVALNSVTAVDGTQVPIRATISEGGKDKQLLSLLVGIALCILGLFLIKGDSAVIPAGTEVKAYVDIDVEIKV